MIGPAYTLPYPYTVMVKLQYARPAVPTVMRAVWLVDVAETTPSRAILDHWDGSFQRFPLGFYLSWG